MAENVKQLNGKLLFVFLFLLSTEINAQVHSQEEGPDKQESSRTENREKNPTWEAIKNTEKHTSTPQEVKDEIKESFLRTGELPEGCRIYFGAVVCKGPQGSNPPAFYADISTRHSKSGTAASFFDSLIQGRENTRVNEAEFIEAYNKRYAEDPQKATEWLRRLPPYVEDRIAFVNGAKVVTGPELKEAYEDWAKRDPEAAAEWLNERPHAKKNMEKKKSI